MICKFNHDGDCCNSGAVQYMCKCKQPCATIIPMTNADRIRAMSDEELCDFLMCDVICDQKMSPDCTDCEKCVLDWLQQPAEEVKE